MRLYRLSAAPNFPHAQTNLGFVVEHRCGVERDPFEAVRLYRAAAKQHFAVAQVNLGVMCAKGCGAAQDQGEAVKWYRQAAAQGSEAAIKALRCLGYDG